MRIDLKDVDDPVLQNDITKIASGEDALPGPDRGDITERLVEKLFANNDVETISPSILKIEGKKGFDHVLIQRDDVSGEIIDLIIVDSKQKNKGVTLSSLVSGDVQLSDRWIKDVVRRMRQLSKPAATRSVGDELAAFLENNVAKKMVAFLDRTAEEVLFVNVKL